MSTETTTANPADDPKNICVARKEGVTLFSHAQLDVLMQMPLPGITIFVHGVNSDAEWYEQAEKGLCEGLKTRLARRDEQLKHCGPEAGQLSPARYMDELTPNGFINPEMDARTFIQSDDTFSPVIRFRWGYKANGEELQQFGAGIYLNEENYWGGGPFANGCTSLPDLWGQGLSENMFLWVHVQHLNPTNDRQVYSCPPRPYYVLAAHRLARLVESIRSKQADVPITIVCHSQGNMVGMAAAFLGDKMPDVTDASGHSGRCWLTAMCCAIRPIAWSKTILPTVGASAAWPMPKAEPGGRPSTPEPGRWRRSSTSSANRPRRSNPPSPSICACRTSCMASPPKPIGPSTV